jgi:hypothetical protein
MTDSSVSAIEQRMLAAEDELRLMRQRLADLSLSARHTGRRRWAMMGVIAIGLTAPWWVGAVKPVGTTFKAPFTVVDADNKPILVVWENSSARGVSIRNKAGAPAATMQSREGRFGGTGSLATYDGASGVGAGPGNNLFQTGFSEAKVAFLVVGDANDNWVKINGASLGMSRAGVDSVELFTQDGGGGLKLHGKSGKPVVYLGSSRSGQTSELEMMSDGNEYLGLHLGTTPAGAGAMHVFNDGDLRSVVNAPLGFRALNSAGQVLAEIGSVQSGGAGRLWLGNAAGAGVVEAGMLPDGNGTVRAGPVIGGLPSGIVPPDRLVGKVR